MTATPAPAPDGQALEARLAEVVRAHQLADKIDNPGCLCGWCWDDDADESQARDQHGAHVAAALAPIVAAEVERAVGEAVAAALSAATVRIGDLDMPDDLDAGMSARQAWCLGALAARRVVREGGPR